MDLLATLVNPSSDGFRDDIDAGRSTEPSRLAEPATPGIRDTPAADEVVEDKPMASAPCDNPGGIGLSRIVQIDTVGGPGFGVENFKQHEFLREKEVILTFDDGPGRARRSCSRH